MTSGLSKHQCSNKRLPQRKFRTKFWMTTLFYLSLKTMRAKMMLLEGAIVMYGEFEFIKRTKRCIDQQILRWELSF